MAEQRIEYSADKASAYGQLAEEIASVVSGETSRTARYATTVSLLKAAFGERFFWCGFYEVDPRKERELVVGPYQGTLGCLRIPFAKGVCGACATARETIIVPDVHVFPGHIACDSASNSESSYRCSMRQARWSRCLTWTRPRLRRSTRWMRAGWKRPAAR